MDSRAITRLPSFFRLPGYAGRLLVGLLGLVGGVIALSAVFPPRPGQAVPALSINQVLRWHDRGHDWLIVTDHATHALFVYDAATGAPLRRLDASDGLGQVESIAQSGSRLLVHEHGVSEPRSLDLAELQSPRFASR